MRTISDWGCIVSGSSVVAILEADDWTRTTTSDLDIYVPEDALTHVVGILLRTGDYTVMMEKDCRQHGKYSMSRYNDYIYDCYSGTVVTDIRSVTRLFLRRNPKYRIELIATITPVRQRQQTSTVL